MSIEAVRWGSRSCSAVAPAGTRAQIRASIGQSRTPATDPDLQAIEAELWRQIRDDAAAAERDIEDTKNRRRA